MSVVAGGLCPTCNSFLLVITVNLGQSFVMGTAVYMSGSTFSMCPRCDAQTLMDMKFDNSCRDLVLCSSCEVMEIEPKTKSWNNPLCKFCYTCSRCEMIEVAEDLAHFKDPLCQACYDCRPGSCTCFQAAPCSYCTDEPNWSRP